MTSVSKTKMRLLEFISSQNGLDFSGCRARMSKKKNLLVEDYGNLVISESEENSDGKQKYYKRNKENEKKLPTY